MTDVAVMSEPVETIEVQNVVGAADFGRELDLMPLAMDLTGAEYDPENFPGLLYRMQDPKATVMIFESGKATVTGAASTATMRSAFETCVAALRDLGVRMDDAPSIEVTNIVTRADLGEHLNLNAVAIGLGLEQTEYEPEQFPGLVYRLDTPEVAALLFGSGKMVVTGADERESIETAVEMVATRLADLGLLDGGSRIRAYSSSIRVPQCRRSWVRSAEYGDTILLPPDTRWVTDGPVFLPRTR